MIDPQRQWAVQIEVTNACQRRCSNCTRLTAHVREPFFMSVGQFATAVESLKDFPSTSPPSSVAQAGGRKVVGMLGGEPLLHPEFRTLCEIMAKVIPDREQRGLWTGIDWTRTRHARLIRNTFGYVNNNLHDRECRHSPVLVACQEAISDPSERKRSIDDCWLQRLWSASVTPKGFFFCEVAGAFDAVFGGPGGLPVEPGCWRRPLSDFQAQIDRWCQMCGIPLNLEGRMDSEEVDDISPGNLDLLRGSPRVRAGKYLPHDLKREHERSVEPWRYLR